MKMIKKVTTYSLILFFTIANHSSAQLKMPTFFADYMVMQQNSSNVIWGSAAPHQKISVEASWGEYAYVVADDEGKWKAVLKTPSYRTDQFITIKTTHEKLTLKQVAIGEVWLCLGQSNMGWSLKNCFQGIEDAAQASNPLLRIYKSDRQHWHQPKKDCPSGKWSVSNPSSAEQTSAVAWYFGSTLQQQLGIPVGIIVQAYAGTPVEGWMPYEIQLDNAQSVKHKNDLDATVYRQMHKQGMTTDGALAKYEQELMVYRQKELVNDSMLEGGRKLLMPVITKPAHLGNQYPGHIYNAMVHPLAGYGIKGIVWYQGERNSKTVQQAYAFKEQLKLLINYYRSQWHIASNGNVPDDFFFSLTQLPGWGKPQSEPVQGVSAPWAVSRQIMFELKHELSNIGLAVSIDTGSPVELHPKNKKPIGLRHAYCILHDVYDINKVGHGPFLRSFKIIKDTIELSFDGVGSGLVASKNESINSFAIAAKDGEWVWAEAKIEGDKVLVYSEGIKAPLAVRYAWAMNPSQRNLLYNKEGFPASPFRTDDWPLFKDNEQEVLVDKPLKQKAYVSKDWYRPQMKW